MEFVSDDVGDQTKQVIISESPIYYTREYSPRIILFLVDTDYFLLISHVSSQKIYKKILQEYWNNRPH